QNGVFHRSRNTFCAYCYNKNLGLDFSNGSLYEITQAAFTDGGQAIPWIRSFPHVVNELKYVQHAYFMADVQAGTMPNTTEQKPGVPPGLLPTPTPPSLTPSPPEQPKTPVVYFRMSKDGGGTWGKPRSKANISAGRYRPKMRWRNLGIATDAVFELSSTAQMCPALQGGWIEPISSQV
ncbi:MAG: hypothetical protein C5B60_05830, partial [Chloroflexi bacterium]